MFGFSRRRVIVGGIPFKRCCKFNPSNKRYENRFGIIMNHNIIDNYKRRPFMNNTTSSSLEKNHHDFAVALELKHDKFSYDDGRLIAKSLSGMNMGSSKEELISSSEKMGTEGLTTLLKLLREAESSQEERLKRPVVKYLVKVPHERDEFIIEGREGDILYSHIELKTKLSEYLECACGGKMMCSTCHVYLDDKSFDALPPPDEAEIDMIDLAYEPKRTSRLGCQIELVKSEHMMEITIPEKSVNHFN